MSNTGTEIINYLEEFGQGRVEDMRRSLGVSNSIIHRYLKGLSQENIVARYGSPPKVFYRLNDSKRIKNDLAFIAPDIREFINKNYNYVTPSGIVSKGVEGFNTWLSNIKLKPEFKIYDEYVNVRNKANTNFNTEGYINATDRLEGIFSHFYLQEVYYSDFYSLPKFGKTKLGNLVTLAKTSENKKLIVEIGQIIETHLKKIIDKHQIDGISFIPHSIKRRVAFLPELRKYLNLTLPELPLEKAFRGEIVPQKSLKTQEQRVENARDTIFLGQLSGNFNNILLIDDVIGSGATMNEVAAKISKVNLAKKIYGYAIVGSYNGFDVVPVA